MKSRRRTSVEKRDIYIVGGICLCNGALFWRSNGRFILFVKLLMQEGAIDGCFPSSLFSYQYHCAIHITCLRHNTECGGGGCHSPLSGVPSIVVLYRGETEARFSKNGDLLHQVQHNSLPFTHVSASVQHIAVSFNAVP